MVAQKTRHKVDAFWSSALDISVADLHAPGIRVRPNPPGRETWRGVYVLAFEGVTIFAPQDLCDAIGAAVADSDPDSLLEAKTWRDLLGPQTAPVRSVWGPVPHNYLDSAIGLGELATGRRLNPNDSGAIATFRSALDRDDWVVTGFTARSTVLFGIFDGESIVAAANLTPGPAGDGFAGATDLGFAVHPSVRGRGYGTQIAALAAKQAIALHGLARYRSLTSVAATGMIANRLGFQEYGRSLVAYFSEPTEAIW